VHARCPRNFFDIAAIATSTVPFLFSLATRNSSLRRRAW